MTPSFDQGRFLPDCLASVARQTYPRIQLIVIDNGSTDGSRRALAALRERHDFELVLQDNVGLVGATEAYAATYALYALVTLAGVALVIVVSGHWMLGQLVGFTHQLFDLIPRLIST